jgi:hypothetical protein
MIKPALSIGFVSLVLVVAPAAGHALGPPPPMSSEQRKRIDAEMLKLELGTRMEQRCNARAMGIVRREHWPMNPDEGVPSAFADADVDGVTVHAAGAAIRSGGNWYHIAYDCMTTGNGLDIVTFRYSLRAVIPKSEWSLHDLVAP